MLDYTRVHLRSVDCCAGSVQLRMLTYTVDKIKRKRGSGGSSTPIHD